MMGRWLDILAPLLPSQVEVPGTQPVLQLALKSTDRMNRNSVMLGFSAILHGLSNIGEAAGWRPPTSAGAGIVTRPASSPIR